MGWFVGNCLNVPAWPIASVQSQCCHSCCGMASLAGSAARPRTVVKAMAPMTAAKPHIRTETPSSLSSSPFEALSPSMRCAGYWQCWTGVDGAVQFAAALNSNLFNVQWSAVAGRSLASVKKGALPQHLTCSVTSVTMMRNILVSDCLQGAAWQVRCSAIHRWATNWLLLWHSLQHHRHAARAGATVPCICRRTRRLRAGHGSGRDDPAYCSGTGGSCAHARAG